MALKYNIVKTKQYKRDCKAAMKSGCTAEAASAQKKTKALKWLAEKLDGEGREIGRDAHAAIIAYAAMRG